MGVEVTWKEIPPAPTTTTKWGEIAALLRTKPGKSALVATYASRNAAYVAASLGRQNYPDCDFQARGLEVYGVCHGGKNAPKAAKTPVKAAKPSTYAGKGKARPTARPYRNAAKGKKKAKPKAGKVAQPTNAAEAAAAGATEQA